MQSRIPGSTLRSLLSPRTWLAGATGSVVTLGIVLAMGLLAYAPVGVLAGPMGWAAVLVTASVGATLFALLARCPLPCGGPSSATAIVLAGLVAQVIAARPPNLALALASACGAAVCGMGLLQWLMGALRLGRLGAQVPQPVLAGFMNGVALLVLLAQWPLLSSAPGATALALGTAAAAWGIGRIWPQAPAALLALAAASLLLPLLPPGSAGPTLAAGAAGPMVLPLAAWAAGLPEPGIGAIALHALVLALTGSLEAVLSMRALDQQLHQRSSPDRLLLACGAANLVGGLLGALPLTLVRSAATAMAPSGVRGPAPALAATLCTTALLTLAGAALRWLPSAAVAGIMLTIGVGLADRWSRDLMLRAARRPATLETGFSLAIVAVVAVVTAIAGTPAGVGVGLVLAAVSFMRGLRGSVIRGFFDGRTRPSRRVRAFSDEERLAPLRTRIQGLELQGALFFASVERVAEACDALPADTRFVVLDLRRLNAIDDSGATLLAHLRERLARRGATLMLASVDADGARGRQLAAYGLSAAHWYPDADRAIEAAEAALLSECPDGAAPDALPLAGSVLLQGVAPADAAWLCARMPARPLAAGERLFRKGEAGDALYVVTSGAVDLRSPDGGHRFATCCAGTVFGEMALLDGGGRTADAVADGPAVVHGLSHEVLAQLQAERPAVAAQLYRNLALHLAVRLRAASSAWLVAAG